MKISQLLLVLTAILSITGCSSLISSATQKMADNLSVAMLNQDDPETVKAGAPAYLIMIDSLIEGDPENVALLISGAKLYASYSSAFVADEKRAKRLADKSFKYASKALCLDLQDLCQTTLQNLDEIMPILNKTNLDQQPVLYAFASAWANWIQVNTDNWNALAQIPKLTAMFNRSVELDERYDRGGAHLYLGVLSSQIPPSLGGKPEQGRAHFEKALQISQQQNLMTKVLFAEHYARLIFDQELHDQLLQEVLGADAHIPGLTLINTLAQVRARQLLDESAEFF